MMIIVEKKALEITETCDVLVAGGGIAGVSAALAAARNGARVILLEREYGIGGMATLGLIAIYLPLCDGMGNQVCGGISEELFRLSIKHGVESDPSLLVPWLEGGTKEERAKHRLRAQFNPIYFSLEMEKLLRKEGIHILYGSLAADTVMADNRVEAVIIENKSGRSAISAGMYVDATGDAELFHQADLETSLFTPKNALASWYNFISRDSKTQEIRVKLSMFGLADVREDEKDENEEIRQESISDFRFSGINGTELSEAVQRAHALMLDDINKNASVDKEFQPASMSMIPLVRMSRKINGIAVLSEQDVHVHCNHSIGMTGDWCKKGPVYEIPFESLYTSGCSNLLAAGRIISTDEILWNATRVIPPCAVTGEAAGTAAAIAVKSDVELDSLSVKKLQDQLQRQGVLLHEEDAK